MLATNFWSFCTRTAGHELLCAVSWEVVCLRLNCVLLSLGGPKQQPRPLFCVLLYPMRQNFILVLELVAGCAFVDLT